MRMEFDKQYLAFFIMSSECVQAYQYRFAGLSFLTTLSGIKAAGIVSSFPSDYFVFALSILTPLHVSPLPVIASNRVKKNRIHTGMCKNANLLQVFLGPGSRKVRFRIAECKTEGATSG